MDTSLALTPRHQSEDKLVAIRNALHWCKLIVIATGKWTDRIELYLKKGVHVQDNCSAIPRLTAIATFLGIV
jgi:hypothetical protein